MADPDALLLELLLTPEGRADPYPRYEAIRAEAPRHRSAMGALWVVTGYDDCREVLGDNRFGKSDGRDLPGDAERIAAGGGMGALLAGPELEPELMARMEKASEGNSSLLRLNPPDHTRLRGLVSRAFTPKRVDRMRDEVRAMADEILDGMAAAGEVDVLDALAFPLPVRVIGELVGVPRADRDRFRGLVRAAASSLEFGTDAAGVHAAIDAMEEMGAYFRDLIGRRRQDPHDDLVSALLAASDEHDGRLSESEMVGTLILIFAAGFETTTNLIGNGLLTLLRHPDELARLRADGTLVPAAVEEILRFESPVQLDVRRALTDATIGGQAGDEPLAVGQGDWVITLLAAANRDPAVFDDPQRFHIVPRDASVLSFAHGIHYCLGASLARMEGQVVFDRLLDRFPVIDWLDPEPAWRNSLILRGLDHLHVRVA